MALLQRRRGFNAVICCCVREVSQTNEDRIAGVGYTTPEEIQTSKPFRIVSVRLVFNSRSSEIHRSMFCIHITRRCCF